MRKLREAPLSLLEKTIGKECEQLRLSILLTGGSLFLCICTGWLLWSISGWASAFQAVFILTVSILGENYVSELGYYRYTEANCWFILRVPMWIPFMWIVVIQGSFIVISFTNPFNWIGALLSGSMCSLIDLCFIEPYFCRRKMLWSWSPVENGYFVFVPEGLYRFTAPPGNYITWFIFPVLSNVLLIWLKLLSFPL